MNYNDVGIKYSMRDPDCDVNYCAWGASYNVNDVSDPSSFRLCKLLFPLLNLATALNMCENFTT